MGNVCREEGCDREVEEDAIAGKAGDVFHRLVVALETCVYILIVVLSFESSVYKEVEFYELVAPLLVFLKLCFDAAQSSRVSGVEGITTGYLLRIAIAVAQPSVAPSVATGTTRGHYATFVFTPVYKGSPIDTGTLTIGSTVLNELTVVAYTEVFVPP